MTGEYAAYMQLNNTNEQYIATPDHTRLSGTVRPVTVDAKAAV